jgi:hypothetical protein
MNGQVFPIQVSFNGQDFVGQFGNFKRPNQSTPITINATATDPSGAVSTGSAMITLLDTCPVLG